MIHYIIKFLCFVGSKAQAVNQLYTENRILKELGVAAVETIERMDEKIELKDNKINVLEKELKDTYHYDEEKIQTLLNKKPVIRNNNKELNVDYCTRFLYLIIKDHEELSIL